jgi:TDG/mug DNA glycosylase family protein
MNNARPTKADLLAAYDRRIHDLIGPGVSVLFVGINPSLYSAAVGYHFARPGNRFWPALFGAGFTERLLVASQQQELLAAGYGITNLVARATARADELEPEELVAGARKLATKVRRHQIANVAVLGVSAYNLAFSRQKTTVGWQPDHQLGGANVWVLPNPSGLNAHYQLPELIRIYTTLRAATH